MATISEHAKDFCRAILPEVSRTFSLSIRLLPGQLGAAVREAYLLCRIVDTVEDAPGLSAAEKAALLTQLDACFDNPAAVLAFVEASQTVGGEPAHVRLVRNAGLVFVAYRALPPQTQWHIQHWVREMIGGMRAFVLRYPQGIRIQSVEEYREYCYYVAGTVGYLLTDLWREHSPSIGQRQYDALRARCRAFAEALQTVNILKDIAQDAEHENAIYLPAQLLNEDGGAHRALLSPERVAGTHVAFGALTELAWRDLEQATAYLLAIPRRAIPIRLFCALPLLFAYATLRDLTRAPHGLVRREVVKISRAEVKSITVLSMVGVWSNSAIEWLVARTRARPLRLWRESP